MTEGATIGQEYSTIYPVAVIQEIFYAVLMAISLMEVMQTYPKSEEFLGGREFQYTTE